MTQLAMIAPTIGQRFAEFHEANPHVYDMLKTLALQWHRATGKRIGMKALFERARWEIGITTTDPDFRINNNYTAYYARLLMAQEPDLADMFHLRHSDADMWVTP